MTLHHEIRTGLDGVAAAATVLSHVDGERGELVIAGERVADLAGRVRFEAVAGRLWALAKGATPAEASAAATGAEKAVGAARRRAFARLRGALDLAKDLEPVVAMRAVVAALVPEDGIDDEATLTGGFGVAAAALLRRALGGEPVAPDPDLPHAADLLRMARGATPEAAEAEALDTYLVTAIDHGMNASTFAGRVVASTGADLFMAATAAYCALTGPLHGGAPGPVLDMLDAIGTGDNIAPWIRAALARGERLMGFGHRIYKVRDPRADVLRAAVARLGGRG
ncbi:MAG TPA: citrate synthase/methylcitrate synthase, partial [Rhizobiales bacterium]|nr:citrate synthase/methylcitrate synthase [Hyphomicrobiales bacterium]